MALPLTVELDGLVVKSVEMKLAGARVAEPVASGASLTALTVKETRWLERVLMFGAAPEPLSTTSKVMKAVPFALATVL